MPLEEKETVCILLASFNGQKYIGDQIESLILQTYTNWKLFIRDDGSADQTVNIIKEYTQKDKRITVINDERKSLGSCQNFSALLEITRSPYEYIMFCDQDDYWLPFKVEETLDKMLSLEKQCGKDVPLLVHSNFKYVDTELKEILSRSGFQATKTDDLDFAQLLAQNPVYGCTMMINKKLSALVGKIPPEAENHDYWVALIASALGKISYLDKQTILYRQHSHNISTNFDSNSLQKRFKRIFLQRKNFTDVHLKMQMVLALRKNYYNMLSNKQKLILDQYINFGTGKKGLLFKNIQNGVKRQTFAQTVLFYMSMLFMQKRKKVV